MLSKQITFLFELFTSHNFSHDSKTYMHSINIVLFLLGSSCTVEKGVTHLFAKAAVAIARTVQLALSFANLAITDRLL